jgi:site-specific DNA recombinase
VTSMLAEALTRPATLVERLDTAGVPGDQKRKMLGHAARLATALSGSPAERARIVRGLVEKVVIDEERIIIKVRCGALFGRAEGTSDQGRDSTIEMRAAVHFKRRGVETKLVLSGAAHHQHGAACDPTLVKAIARGRAWFEELATGRVRSLHDLAQRDGITRRYIRRLVNLAFLSPQLVEAILQGRQPIELTVTRLSERDLPLDWTEQHRLLAT